ncbi:hypothetical protein QTV43_003620 [Vibrio vulnificus]|nr:hypothetical protein [Vibrio vulnificus]
MNIFLKRLTVYSLCFVVCFIPTRYAYSGWWGGAAVVIDVITDAWVDGDDVKTGAICGGRKFASNDPIWKCETKNSKSNFMNKAKASSKGLALFVAAGFLLATNGNFGPREAFECHSGERVDNFQVCYSAALETMKASADRKNWYVAGPTLKVSPSIPWSTIHINVLLMDKETGLYVGTDSRNVRASTPDEWNALSDDELFNDFWQTSPKVPPETWLPPSGPNATPPSHPDPEWFPETFPVSPPYSPKPGAIPEYPKPLPDSHPDKRPESEPAPVPNPDWFPSTEPGKNPDSWPQEVPSPGQKPVPWPLPDREPSINPNPNPDPDPNPNPDPDPNPNPDPDPNPLPIPLPVIGPITREQFRTEQQRFYDEAASALPQPTTFFSDHADTVQKAMSDFLENKITPDVPEFEFNIFGYFTFGGGSCSGFTVPASMGRISGEITLDKHCQPWDSTFRPTIEWSLYLMTGLYIYVLFSRTVRSV